MSNFETKLNQSNSPDIGKIIDLSFLLLKNNLDFWNWNPINDDYNYTNYFFVIFNALDISSMEDFIKISPTLGTDMNYMLINAAVGIPLAGFTALLTAGFYKMNHLASNDKEFGLNNLFDYFKSPYLMNLFICGALTALYSDVLALGLIYLNIPIGATLIQLLITFLFVLAIPLIIFENQTALQAMSNSSKLAIKHPFAIIICLIFATIIAMLGIFALCIGLFFTIGYFYTMNYTLYNEIVPIESKNPFDEIGQE